MSGIGQLLRLISFEARRKHCLRNGGHAWTAMDSPLCCKRCGTTQWRKPRPVINIPDGRWW